MPFEKHQIGPHTLYRGDAVEVLASIEPEQVSAVIVDPPYGIDYQSKNRKDKSKIKPKILNDKEPFVWFLPGAYRLALESACLLCFCRWDVQDDFLRAIGWAGWKAKSQIVWDRESHGMGDLNGSPAPQHDVIWFATKGDYKLPGERPKSVVRAMRLPGEELVHPNQKPQSLMADLVTSYAPKESTVLDCFLGSGSTGMACIETGRRFIGCELDPRHFDTACKRMEEAYGKGSLFESVPDDQTQSNLFAQVN